MKTFTIVLDEYHVANLKAAIEAIGYPASPPDYYTGPLAVLNNGDWIGELYQMLPEKVDCFPNATPEELRAEAREALKRDKSNLS